MCIRMRRATRYEPPSIQAELSSVSAPSTHTNFFSRAVSVPAMLRVPSLKPSRLRGVCASGVVDEVLPKPSCDQRTETLPKPIRARLRTACTATCGSSEHACTHTSPPLRFLSRLSPGNCGRSTSASGRRSASPSFSNRPGPNPIVSVSRDGFSPSASPVSSGGASARPPYAPSPTACPAVIRRAAAVQSLSICTNSARSSVSRSNAAKCSLSCTGVAIPAWCPPWKSTAPPASAATVCTSSLPRVIATALPAAAAPSASPAPPQPISARREVPPAVPSVVSGVSVMTVGPPLTSRRRRRAWTAAPRARSPRPRAACDRRRRPCRTR